MRAFDMNLSTRLQAEGRKHVERKVSSCANNFGFNPSRSPSSSLIDSVQEAEVTLRNKFVCCEARRWEIIVETST